MSIHEGLSALPGRVLSRRRISSPAKNPIAYASWTAARSTSFKARRVQRIFSLGKVQRLLTAVSTRLSATLGSSSLGMWTCIAPVLPEYKIPHQTEHSMRRSSGYLLCGDRCSDFRSLGDLLLRLLNGSLLRRHFHWTFSAAFFAAVFFAARFFATAGFSACFAAWNAAQRFFVASPIARLPASLSFRFGASDAAAGDCCGSEGRLDSAHRFRCASPMCFRAAVLIFRRLPFGPAGVAAGSERPPRSMVQIG